MAERYFGEERLRLLTERFNEKFNKKDYLNALLTVDSLEKSGCLELTAILYRTKVLFQMERYSQAIDEWFKYLTKVSNQKKCAVAYNGLGACYYRLGDDKVAGYYFNRQIMSDKRGIFDYSYVTAEFYEDVLSADKNYYLAYPYDKADFTKKLLDAEDLLKMGDYEGAENELSVIPNTSKYYPSALITLSIAKYFKGDIDGAKKDIELSIKLEPKAVAICNAISMFTAEKDDERANFYLDMLKTVELSSSEDLYKISMIYCERGEHHTALEYAKKYLKESPYDASTLMLYGMMNYNLESYAEAEESFKKAYQINRGYITKYYLKLSEKRTYKSLEYTFDLQANDKLQALKKITSLMKASAEDRLIAQGEAYDLAKYAFSSNSYQLQSSVVTLLGELATETAVEIMKKALISVSVYDRIKAGILGFLTADGFDGEQGAVFGNIFRKIKFYKAEFIDKNSVFTEAYAYVFAKFAPVEKDLEPLKTSAESIYQKLKEKGVLNSVLDVRSLSAVIYELSTIAKIKSRREFASFFEANLREIKRIKSLIDEKPTE